MSFIYFPKVASNHWRYPLISFRSFMDHVTIFSTSSMKNLRWSSLWQNLGDCWKLPFTVVTESFVLNVEGLLDPTLKNIDKFRLNRALTFQKKLFYFLQWKLFENDKNAFYFILKQLFVPKIFNFFSWLCGHVKNGLIRNVRLISKFMTPQPC